MTFTELRDKYRNEIVEKNFNGESFVDLAKEYGVKKSYIYDIIAPSYRHDPKQVTEEEISKIKELYANGTSSVGIAEMLHIHHKTILDFVRDETPVVLGRFKRIHSLNENFFDAIDSQDKAYILGFLYADGYNSEDKRAIRLQLTEGDKEILLKISSAMEYTRPLTYVPARPIYDLYVSKPQYALDINSAHMSRRLSQLGVVQNKSLILQFPDWLNEDLIPHFLRGYIDGDGTIVTQCHSYGVSFIQTDQFCKSVREIVDGKLRINAKISEASNHNGITMVWAIHNKKDTKTFLDWIYADAHLYLKRKHNIYLEKYSTIQ